MTQRLPAGLVRLQDRVADLLGRSPDTRADLVASLLRRERSEVAFYWLQLLVAAGIATLGLVLGSTAVVIGAMLIAPLMEPIVNLGMGLAVGSPFLVLRSLGRVVASVLVVICLSAFIVWLLPFHELNSEIAARTAPTALDLLTAAFCALAGVYAALRAGSETATTAAGTSIGISLVPPLCASGYGVGTGALSVAGGAALLFLTNFAAIVFVATVSFVAAGMNQIDIARIEREALASAGPARFSRAIARRLQKAFASGSGSVLRFAMPLVLLTALYLPLRQALDEVAWQVRVRAQVEKALEDVQGRLVEKRLRVERGSVDLTLVLIGSGEEVTEIEAALDQRIRTLSGVAPRIEVHAVPDAATLAGLVSAMRAPATTFIPPPPPPDPVKAWGAGSRAIEEALQRHWPARASGPVLALSAELGGDDLQLQVTHHGADLGAGAREVLESALKNELERTVVLHSRGIPSEPILATAFDSSLVGRIVPLLERSRDVAEVSICLTEKKPPARKRRPRDGERMDEAVAEIIRASVSAQPRVSVREGDQWAIQFVRGACATTSTTAADAGRAP